MSGKLRNLDKGARAYTYDFCLEFSIWVMSISEQKNNQNI